MPKILITGAGGLIGATCLEHFSASGWEVIGLENGGRGQLLGSDGNTLQNLRALRERYPAAQLLEVDVRDQDAAAWARQVDAIVHCAAQTSHPRSIEIPLEDADINIRGTLNLLDALREAGRRDVPFVFCSTNKVYGDAPNEVPFVERETRYELADLPHGFDETLRLDRVLHTPFGVSKTAADLYTQDYGRLYGLPTAAFRLGCITGPWSRATVFQNWITYFILCALTGRPLTIYGYEGKQVRDNLDARDLARAFERFIAEPSSGAVYNLGGGPANSVSCLEAIDRIEALTGRRIDHDLGLVREGDHRIYITDNRRFARDYPGWRVEIGIDRIFSDLVDWVTRTLEEDAVRPSSTT
jgi:CDP-paratose 2-epimerase